MTAKTLVRERASEEGVRELTAKNVQKVTRYREGGMEDLEKEVRRMEKVAGDEEVKEVSLCTVSALLCYVGVTVSVD